MKTYIKVLIAVGFLLGGTLLTAWYGEHRYSTGVSAGSDKVQVEFNLYKNNALKEALRLKEHYDGLEKKNREETEKITSDLQTAKVEYEKALSSIASEYTSRLRTSETRSAIYKHLSESGSVERANLADHAARLDSSLEEGRSLVRELGETLRLRDKQLIGLGQKLTSDQTLKESNSNEPALSGQ